MLRLDKVGYRYPLAPTPALQDVSLELGPGERVLLCGRSGGGKSTLLRLASGLLARHGSGQLTGSVSLDGRNPADLAPRERAALLGFVGQDPRDQLVAGSVADEVAFGPEGQGWEPAAIEAAVHEALERVGLTVGPWRDPLALSGGQQQRLAVAAALAGGGRLLILDEPLARLDPDGAGELLDVLDRLADAGVTVLLAEHRLERCLAWADRVVALDAGRLAFDGAATEARSALDGLELLAPGAPSQRRPVGEVVLALDRATVRYGQRIAVDGVSLEVHAGERVALVGANGAGKSSLLGALSGRLLSRGSGPRVIEVPQDPDLALFCDTVREELAYGPEEAGCSREQTAARVARVAGPLGLEPLLERPPQGLSSGERLRVAVGAALTCEPSVLLLDEPTAGQDARSIRGLLEALAAAAPDAAVVFATHDLALAEREAHRVVRLAGGRLAATDPEPYRAIPEPHQSPGSGLDPRVRLALLGVVGLLAVILDRPLSLALLAGLSAGVLLALPIGWTWRRRALGLAAALTWTTALSQGLFYGEVPRVALVELGPITLWREGVWHGLAQSLRMLAAAFAGVAVAVSTSTDRLVAGLGALRVPWAIGLMAAVALRGVPSTAEAWAGVRVARAGRGRPIHRRTPWAWLALETRLLRPVAARALRRARALALSLDARGFDPDAPRTLRRPLRLAGRDVAVLVPVIAVGVGAVGLELLYRAYLAEALYLPALRPVYGWVRAWL